jgi:hypothetical protein
MDIDGSMEDIGGGDDVEMDDDASYASRSRVPLSTNIVDALGGVSSSISNLITGTHIHAINK